MKEQWAVLVKAGGMVLFIDPSLHEVEYFLDHYSGAECDVVHVFSAEELREEMKKRQAPFLIPFFSFG